MRSLTYGSAAKKGAVILLASAAWLLSCYAEPVLRRFYEGSFQAPRLPHVGNVPWNDEADFFSAAGHIGVMIIIAVAVAVLVEIAKSISAAGGHRTYLAALVFQVAVAGAAFKHAGLEWPGHFASLLLNRGAERIIFQITQFGPSWPWPPIAALLALAAVVLLAWRRPAALTEPGRRLFRWAGSQVDLAWLAGSWLLGALARQATDLWIPPNESLPHLGNVAAVPWTEAGEPQSTTAVICGALFFAVLAVLLVEIVKAAQIRRGRRAAYWPLLALQVVLFCDIVAAAAPDWASYALSSILGAPVPMEAFPSWPWISLLAMGLLLLPDFAKKREALAG